MNVIDKKKNNDRVRTINCLVAGPDENLGLVNTWDVVRKVWKSNVNSLFDTYCERMMFRHEGIGRGRLRG